jgi:hypothetical protein
LIASTRREQERFTGEASSVHLFITLFIALLALFDRAEPESQRTHLPAAAIAAGLIFSEATNFAKFFTRRTGLLPCTFRETCRVIPG